MSTDGRPDSPFGTEVLKEVHLDRAPLLRVIAQVRWDPLSRLQGNKFSPIAEQFGDDLSEQYPIVKSEPSLTFSLGPAGAAALPGETVLKLYSDDGAWEVSLTSTFLTVTGLTYSSRSDICARLRSAVDKLTDQGLKLPVQRLGFRYVNRVDDETDLQALDQMVYPEALGYGPVSPTGLSTAKRTQAMTQSSYQIPGTAGVSQGTQRNLMVRCGRLPPGAGYDPTLPASQKQYWFLDLDASLDGRSSSLPEAIEQHVRDLSDVAYRFFRWSVKDSFLSYFEAAEPINPQDATS